MQRENFYFTKRGTYIRVHSAISFNTNTNTTTILDLKSKRFALRRVVVCFSHILSSVLVYFSQKISLFTKTQVFFSVCCFLLQIFILITLLSRKIKDFWNDAQNLLPEETRR